MVRNRPITAPMPSAGVVNIITRKGQEGLSYGGAVEAGTGWAASGFVSQREARAACHWGSLPATITGSTSP